LFEAWYDGIKSYNTVQKGDSTTDTSTNSSGNFGISYYTIGANTNTGDPYYLTGSISEIFVFDRALTTTERKEMEGYMSWKWGLQVNLPTSHPYKSVAPAIGESVPIAPICFPAGTLIDTDQGKIAIELIDIKRNTIRGMKIVGITETISMLNYLVCIEKNALGKSIPSIDTIISPNHKIFYNRQMIESRYLINKLEGVYPIKYSGDILYNVLLERHEKMMVNNLIVETLDPENVIAQIYSNKFSKEKREYLIKKYNNFIKTKSRRDYVELSKYLK